MAQKLIPPGSTAMWSTRIGQGGRRRRLERQGARWARQVILQDDQLAPPEAQISASALHRAAKKHPRPNSRRTIFPWAAFNAERRAAACRAIGASRRAKGRGQWRDTPYRSGQARPRCLEPDPRPCANRPDGRRLIGRHGGGDRRLGRQPDRSSHTRGPSISTVQGRRGRFAAIKRYELRHCRAGAAIGWPAW